MFADGRKRRGCRRGRLLRAGLRRLSYPSPGRGGRRERTGFLTGYFEPELTGSLTPSDGFKTPVLARPDDLVSLGPGETLPGLDPPSCRSPDADGFAAYPDRAAIEDGALAAALGRSSTFAIVVDLFVLQVQGSGRVRLPDGRAVRVLYDGRNGQPYTSIAKRIVAEGHLPLEGLTLARWTAWLRANPERTPADARQCLLYLLPARRDRRPALGPARRAGVPLPRSQPRHRRQPLALWPAVLARRPLARLLRVRPPRRRCGYGLRDRGPRPGDLYLGTGEAAGIAPGNLRDAVGFVVLLPKPRRMTPGPRVGRHEAAATPRSLSGEDA